MLMRNNLLITLLLLTGISLWSVSISHNPPAALNAEGATDLRLQVIEDLDRISRGFVYWRVPGTRKWERLGLRLESEGSQWFIASIPRLRNPFNGVEYYFEFTLKTGVLVTVPEFQPEDYAYQIGSAPKSGRSENAFVLVSDTEDITTDDALIIAISWYEIMNAIDQSSIRLIVNGRDVTGRATVTQAALAYRDEKPQPGMITAFVTARLRGGTSIHSPTWAINVNPGRKRIGLPFDYYGNFNVTTNYHGSSADSAAAMYGAPRDDASSTLDLYTSYGILDLQTNLFVSSLEKSNKQPVNRYTIGLNIPYLEVVAGDYSPDFGHFTIRNRNIRGLFARLHSPAISLYWAHGEMVRKTTSTFSGGIEERNTGTFKQEAIAARIQLGTDRGYKIAFNAVRNRDLKSSLEPDEYRYFVKDDNDAVIDTLYTILPQDNLVLGVEMKITLPDQHMVLGVEGAGSMFNRNTLPGPLTAEDIEEYTGQSIPFDPSFVSELFMLNKNIEPLMPGPDQTAWRAYYRAMIFNNLINISYSEVGRTFRALSTSYQPNDTRNLSISDQFFVKQYVMATLGFNWTQDNISGHYNETNDYYSYIGQLMLRIPRIPYLRFGYNNHAGTNKLNEAIGDTTIFNPTQRNSEALSFGIGYNVVQIPFVPTQVDISWRSSADDGTVNDYPTYDNTTETINVSLISRFTHIPLRTQIGFTTNSNTLKLTDETKDNFNIFLRGEYALWQNRIKPYMEYRNTALSGDQNVQNYNHYTLGLDAYPLKDLQASTSLGWKTYSNNDVQSVDHRSFTWRFMLNQRF